jgi:hypothetical protein
MRCQNTEVWESGTGRGMFYNGKNKYYDDEGGVEVKNLLAQLKYGVQRHHIDALALKLMWKMHD